MKRIIEIYTYREMLFNMVKRDLRTRYKGSAIGFFWTFINPLLQLIVFSIVFSTVLRMNVDKYPMFLFVTLLPWIFFATTTQNATGIVNANGNLVKKVYFPRIVLPLSISISGLINLGLSFLVALIALEVYEIPITISLFALPLVMVIEFVFTLGVSFIVSALNVYYRDIEHLWSNFIMAWFYLTPIVYPLDMVPKKYLGWYSFNPMTSFTIAYRDILYSGVFPDMMVLLKLTLLSCIVCFFGYILYQYLQKGFAEAI